MAESSTVRADDRGMRGSEPSFGLTGAMCSPGAGLGRADIHRPMAQSRFEGIVIEDDVILSPGAKVLCKEGVLRVGRGTVVGANAVLLQSTGEWEIWAGIPARCIGKREALDGFPPE